MKKHPVRYSAIMLLLLAATSCQRSRQSDDIVTETYVHRYGVPLPAEEWSERGQHGQVLSTRKDGVVIAKTYESGVLHGETSYTFPHRETIQKREHYNRGALSQEIFNYSNGIPQQQVTYVAPDQKTLVVWYESGAPQAKETYENGSLIQGEYLTPVGQTESVVNDRSGTRTCRDGYGQLLSVDDIRDGQMVLRTTYHANGLPHSITPYANGVVAGQRRTFLPGGEPQTIEEWTNNQQHGTTVVFENGEKYAEVPYRNGRKNGMERRYRDGQKLEEEINWVNGHRHGPCYSYVGDTKKVDWYFQDQHVNKATYDALRSQQ